MVSRPAPALTKIGFRRDIKYFLATFVGFLIVIILVLLSLLQANVASAGDAMRDDWNLIADAATNALSNTPGDIDLTARLPTVRVEYAIGAIDYIPFRGRTFRTGSMPAERFDVVRAVPAGKAVFHFDAARLRVLERRFGYTAGICLSATILATLLLVAYLPRIVRPIEQLLDQARELGEREAGEDEQNYLLDTFRKSIDTLRAQELELKQLHEAEKTRADELELITATLTRSLTSGFIAIDRDNRIVDVNAAGRDILRLDEQGVYRAMTPGEVLGDTPFSRVLGDALARRATLTRHEVAGAAERVIGLTTVPLVNQAGEHLGMIALFTDLSPVRVLEARVREMQTLAELGEISAGIAHEFRNALSTILGYLKLARKQELATELDAKLRNAEQEAQILSQAVDGLLSFARPMTLDRQQIDVGELVDGIAERLRVTAGGVRIDVRGEPFAVEGDAPLLTRAIENVIRNAVEAVQQKGIDGLVSIEMRQPVVEVRDNGVGVDPADVPRLFLPFQSEKSSGLGLGLALARKVILLHGGTIRLTGTPGAGATATIELQPPQHDWYNLYQSAQQA
jgi:two-component system sensor histidine kinase AtoS